ncbi:MAG TPA: hypothetical protein VGG51_04430 [Candidatus Cybelea sp.]
MNTIHISGMSPNAAPFAAAASASFAGKCHNATAARTPAASPASDACHAGRRSMPSVTSTVAIGAVATTKESGNEPPMGVSIW